MTGLDLLIPTPRLLERDEVELALDPQTAWQLLRHGNLASSPLVRALFGLRTLPGRLLGRVSEPLRLTLDEFTSTPEKPGFQLLGERESEELVVGAIGKVWKMDIPFVHVPDAREFEAFDEPDYIKVAWALRLSRLGERDCRVTFELRVTATDEDAWRKFRAYFALIGPASRFIRRSLLSALLREHGDPASKEEQRPLPGDELLADVAAQLTHGITIAAPVHVIWPWLVQMGCGRAGFYSYDSLDNAGRPSARELHPELQTLTVGDVLPATPHNEEGFEVLQITAPRALVLGGLYDPQRARQLPFAAVRPAVYWQVTWSFALEPLDPQHTRLHVRARAACSGDRRLHLTWIRFVHRFMERAQLRHLAARAEGRLARDGAHDILEGISGAAVMAFNLLTPGLARRRSHWGVSTEEAAREQLGDDLVATPLWSWTHGVEVAASAHEVWPWLAQIGANKAGFYSYQWLENLAGCGLRNAETVHPEWEVHVGDILMLHPEMPGLAVVRVEPGRAFVAYGAPDPQKRAEGRDWVAVSWLFMVEPLGPDRCRVISRYRCDCSTDLSTRFSFGPAIARANETVPVRSGAQAAYRSAIE
jgi:hypothetical protein